MTHNLPIKRMAAAPPKEPTVQTYRFHFSIYAFLVLLISVHLCPISIIYTTATGRCWLVGCGCGRDRHAALLVANSIVADADD